MRIYYFIIVFFITINGFSQSGKIYNISILTDKSTEKSSVLFNQLQNEIKTVLGQDATIVFKNILENNFNTATAKANYQQLLANDTDIILAFGIINNIVLTQEKNYPKPIVVFGSVNSDFIDLPQDQKTSNINNITYIITPFSYKEDLETFKSLYNYKNVGIIVDQFLPEVLPVKDLFDNYFLNNDSSYKLIPYSKGDDLSKSLNNVDAVYLAGGLYMKEGELDALVKSINKRKLPSFSAFGKKDVENGILATNQPDTNINHFFRRIALNVEAIISGTNPSEIPLYIEYKNKLTINYNTAVQIEFPVQYSLLAKADFINNNTVPVSKFSLSITDIMKDVVGKNLSLEVEKKNINLSEQEVKISKSSYLPNATATINGIYIDPRVAKVSNGKNPEFSTTGSVVLEQLLYSESASANIDIKENLKKAQQEVYNAAELDALLNAAVSYFNALILKTNVKILNKNLQLTKRNLEIAEQSFEIGASGKSDVLRFKSQQAQNTQSLIDAGNQLRQAFNTINQLMNNSISSKIDIDDAILAKGIFKNYRYESFLALLDNPKFQPALIDFLVEEAIKNAPELKNIGYNINVTERNYKLNNTGRFIPTIALQGQYNLAISKSGKGAILPIGSPFIPDGTYNVGLNVSLPIFQQKQRIINRQTAKIQEDQLMIQREHIILNIEKNVNDIVLDIVSEIANIEISKISEENAEESLDLTQNAYQNGAVPVIQLIDAQTNYLSTQLASATANYNYLLTYMQLERAIGYFFLMHSESDNQALIQRASQFVLNKN
ncbi:MAG: hypothetical protein COB60_05650 [Flavobacteriaceae bacterium]|nr:MAG: hypothetical protein COB60_05650 [Flavobacteriaceae bacterium]